MIDRDYFSHYIPPDGKTVFDVMSSKGYCYKLAGENIGWNNYPDDIATEAIHQAFLDSPGHKANIMGNAWDAIGVGAYKGPDRQEDVDRPVRRQVRRHGPRAHSQADAEADPEAHSEADPQTNPAPDAAARPEPHAEARAQGHPEAGGHAAADPHGHPDAFAHAIADPRRRRSCRRSPIRSVPSSRHSSRPSVTASPTPAKPDPRATSPANPVWAACGSRTRRPLRRSGRDDRRRRHGVFFGS